LVARHLVRSHRVRELVLASRRGIEAEGAAGFEAELTELGATVTTAACDVASATSLAALLGEHRIDTVVHTAGVLDDGLVETLTPERLAAVLRPKVRAAWNLHSLLGSARLVFFSAAAATFGSAGQGNYAAANAFLDALASSRQAQGLPGASLGWGLWSSASGMTGALSQADIDRLAAAGVVPINDDLGLALFDAALAVDKAAVLPVRLDLLSLRTKDVVTPLLAELAGPRVVTADHRPLTERLAELPVEDRARVLAEIVRGHVAAVLGHAGAHEVPDDRPFTELGFTSLSAVELRNRLSRATDVRLPATLVFDYPTVDALAAHLLPTLVNNVPQSTGPNVTAELDRLERALASVSDDSAVRAKAVGRLEQILADLRPPNGNGNGTDLSTASTEELLRFIDNTVG
jgi:acyl carrier protein